MSPRVKKIGLGLGVTFLIVCLVTGLVCLWARLPTGRTNFLVLGVAGEDHIAGDLTDTIMFLSFNHQTGRLTLISLPRDIWIPALRTKLNSVYHYRGLEETKVIVAEILDEPINYAFLIDFNVFTDVVDVLGGVEVEVAKSFDDYHFPLPGKENDPCDGDLEYKCRYEHVHFEAGLETMDGERALKYVRSRYAEGEEGTDFARSQRQQRLLAAIKNKLLSPSFLFDPQKISQLIKVILAHLETDLAREEYNHLVKLGLRFKSLQMEALGDDFLINPPPSQQKYDGQWVLVPETGSWEAVQEYVESLLEVS